MWIDLAEPAVPDVPAGIDALLPPWAQGLSLVTLLILIVAAFMRDWVISSSRHEKELAAERKVADVWETNFDRALALNEKLTEALEPVLSSNEAILKAVTEVQEEQRRMRQERGPRR